MSSEKQQESVGVRGEVTILGDPGRLRSDCNLVERAVREGWHVPAEARPEIVARLRGIVAKETVNRWVGGGESGPIQVPDEERADAHAIRAASVLVSMSPPKQEIDHTVAGAILAAVVPATIQDAI